MIFGPGLPTGHAPCAMPAWLLLRRAADGDPKRNSPRSTAWLLRRGAADRLTDLPEKRDTISARRGETHFGGAARNGAARNGAAWRGAEQIRAKRRRGWEDENERLNRWWLWLLGSVPIVEGGIDLPL